MKIKIAAGFAVFLLFLGGGSFFLTLSILGGGVEPAEAQNPNGAMIAGIPPLLQAGFHNAVTQIKETKPKCGITAGILAAIAEKESGFAQGEITTAPDGARRTVTIQENGDVTPTIRAGQSNGGDHDGGRLDGDASLDWALGPMQFMATTFYGHFTAAELNALPAVPVAVYGGDGQGLDGNKDGLVNLNNVFDSTLAAANLLCGASPTGTLLNADGTIDEAATTTAMHSYGGSRGAAQHIERAKEIDAQYAAAGSQMTGGGDITPGGTGNSPQGPIQLANVPGIGPINASIASQASAMLAAAARDGLILTGGSYRSYDEQVALRKAHCGSSYYAIYQMSASSCRPPTARPGNSQHEVGLAIDFRNCGSRSTNCYRWLAANAATFGFKNLPSESWHWSTTGS